MNADAPIQSSFADDPEMMELVEFFIEELDQRTASLDAAFQAHDADTLQDLAHQLKGAAGGYGFQIISDAAAKLETPLKQGQPVQELHDQVQALINICNRVIL